MPKRENKSAISYNENEKIYRIREIDICSRNAIHIPKDVRTLSLDKGVKISFNDSILFEKDSKIKTVKVKEQIADRYDYFYDKWYFSLAIYENKIILLENLIIFHIRTDDSHLFCFEGLYLNSERVHILMHVQFTNGLHYKVKKVTVTPNFTSTECLEALVIINFTNSRNDINNVKKILRYAEDFKDEENFKFCGL